MTVYEMIQELTQYHPDASVEFLCYFKPEDEKEEFSTPTCEIKSGWGTREIQIVVTE